MNKTPKARCKVSKLDRRLLGAVERSDLDLLKAAIGDGADVKVRHPRSGKSVLEILCKRKDISSLRYLYDTGAVHVCDCLYWACLLPCLKQENLNLVADIVERNNKQLNCVPILEAYRKRFHGRTPLFAAASEGNAGIVKYFVEHNLCQPSETDNDGYTALSMAIRNGQYSVFSYLVKMYDSDILSAVTVLDKHTGRSPLHDACEWGHIEAVMYFIRVVETNHQEELLKIILSGVDVQNESPLLVAARQGHFQLIEWFHQRIHNASSRGENIPQDELGLVVLSNNNKGENAFHFACKYGAVRTLERLLEMEKLLVTKEDTSAMHKQTNCGWTSLHYTARYGQARAAKLVLDKGCRDTGTEANREDAPFLLAAAHNHFHVCDVFLESTSRQGNIVVYPNAKNVAGETILHHCCRGLGLRKLKQLLGDGESAANIHYGEVANLEVIEPTRGQTPLLVACSDGNFRYVEYLLEHGARIDVAECNGFTPLHYLSLFGRLDLIQRIMESPSNSSQVLSRRQDKDGRTPLIIAGMYNRVDVVLYLVKEAVASNQIR